MHGGTVVEILGEKVGVESGTHENNLQIRTFCDQVLKHQQQEIAAREIQKKAKVNVCAEQN